MSLRSRRARALCVIGQYGDLSSEFNGQAIKTINFVRLMQESNWFDHVRVVDTRQVARRRFRTFCEVVWNLIRCRDIVLMVSMNGKAFFYPFLFHWGRLGVNRVFQNIIGGSLADALSRNQTWVKYLNGFSANWAETPSMTEVLLARGVGNARYVPNFRFQDKEFCADNSTSPSEQDSEPFFFCTFSRVTATKGIVEAIEAVSIVNQRAGRVVAELDIYGDIDPEFQDEFLRVVKDHSSSTRYRGTVSSQSAVAVLQNYFMLLFPTYHSGEGLPGTLVDALCAGLPAIVSRWRFNEEVVTDGVEGVAFDFTERYGLVNAIQSAILNPAVVHSMAKACTEKSHQYSPEAVLSSLAPDFA